MNHHRPFLTLWVLAVAASVLAFVLHLAMRGRTIALGYELGKARSEQARLREVKRVHELEVASYQTPQRVEMVARSVLHMEPPTAERIITMRDTSDRGRVEETRLAGAIPSGAPPSGKGPTAARNPTGPRGAVAPPTPPAPVATELLMPRITPPKTAAPGASGPAGLPPSPPDGEPAP